MRFAEKLNKMGASVEVVAWVGDRTEPEAWAECQQPDWMLWLAARRPWGSRPSNYRQFVRAACACGRTSLQYASLEDRLVLETAYAAIERWVDSPTKENEEAVCKAHKAFAAPVVNVTSAASYAADAFASTFRAADAAFAAADATSAAPYTAWVASAAFHATRAAFHAARAAACDAHASACYPWENKHGTRASDAASARMADLIRPMFTPNSKGD